MTLRGRVTSVVVVVVFAVVAIVGHRTHAAAEAELVEEVDLELLARARDVVDGVGRGFDGRAGVPADEEARVPDRPGTRLGFLRALERDVFARLLDANGSVLTEFGESFEVGTDPAILPQRGAPPSITEAVVAGGRGRVATVPIGPAGYLQIARPLGEIDQSLADLRGRIVVIGVVAVLLAGLVAWLLAGGAVRPIRRLTAAAEAIAETGELDHPVEGAGDAEVGRLAASFNAMLAALSASRRQQHQLVYDASHELRTPLASLRTDVDVLRSRPDLDEATRMAIIEDVGAEVAELGALVAELVDLATDVERDEAVAPLELGSLARPIVERFDRRGTHRVGLEIGERAIVEGRPGALTRAIRNLVENAAKFAPEGTRIRVVVEGGSVTVHDAGPGIPPAERHAVFDRFHRLESTRTAPGSGLGLAIVRQVVEIHGGIVRAESSPDGGAAVGFTVPTVDD